MVKALIPVAPFLCSTRLNSFLIMLARCAATSESKRTSSSR